MIPATISGAADSSAVADAAQVAPANPRQRGCRGKGSLGKHRENRRERRRAQRNSCDHSTAPQGCATGYVGAAQSAPGKDGKAAHSVKDAHCNGVLQQQVNIAQLTAWNSRELLTELKALVTAQTDALQQQATALQALTASVGKLCSAVSHSIAVETRKKNASDRKRTTGSEKTDYAQLKTDLHGKLTEAIAAREEKAIDPKRTAELKAKLADTLHDTVRAVQQYEACEGRRKPCMLPCDVVLRHNAGYASNNSALSGAVGTSYRGDGLQAYHRYCQDGNIYNTYHLLVDPGRFWYTDLLRS